MRAASTWCFAWRPGCPRACSAIRCASARSSSTSTGNAVKFTERGEIAVAVEVAQRDADAVTLRFTVTDTGIGMDDAQLARLFQPFRQADDSITRKFGGTGLGLSISKQLVELMRGTIGVTSAPGAGSSFSFTVPLGQGAPEAGELAAPQPRAREGRAFAVRDLAPLRGARILLVEDNANNCEVALDFLAAAPVLVDVAAHGGEALRMVQQADYDLVLMDIQMPEVDGLPRRAASAPSTASPRCRSWP